MKTSLPLSAKKSLLLAALAFSAALPMAASAQTVAIASSLMTPAQAADAPVLKGLVIAQRDITGATSAMPSKNLPALAGEVAAEQYRRSLAPAGAIAQEGVADAGLAAVLSPFIERAFDERAITQAAESYLKSQGRYLDNLYFPAQAANDGVRVMVLVPSQYVEADRN